MRTALAWALYITYLLGGVSSFYISYTVAEASVSALFSTVLPHSYVMLMPISCSLVIADSEPVTVIVRIPQNPTSANLHYSPTLRMAPVTRPWSDFLEVDTRRVELPPAQAANLSWTEEPLPSPSRKLVVWVWAPSEEDLSTPLPPYPTYLTAGQSAELRSTSYRAECGIAVLPVSGVSANVVLAVSLVLLLGSYIGIMLLTKHRSAATPIKLLALAPTAFLAIGPSAALLRHSSPNFWAVLYLGLCGFVFVTVIPLIAVAVIHLKRRWGSPRPQDPAD